MRVEIDLRTAGQMKAFQTFLVEYQREREELEVHWRTRHEKTIDRLIASQPIVAPSSEPKTGKEKLFKERNAAPPAVEKPTPLETAIADKEMAQPNHGHADEAVEPAQDPFAALMNSAPEAEPKTEAEAKVKKALKTTKKKEQQDAPVEPKELTIADIRAKGEIVCTELGLPAIQSTLAKFGAERMSDLKVADYRLVIEHFGKIMNDAGKVLQ
jgi:hypothetical protein